MGLSRNGTRVVIIAAAWGFAEATVFFIVPDLWLTVVAVRFGPHTAMRACGFALAGALAGGIVMYGFGSFDPIAARTMLDWVPAVGPAMIAGVHDSLASDGIVALLAGPLAGIPYKIYAVEAPHAGIGFLSFLAFSVPARLIRFVATTILALVLSRLLAPYVSEPARLRLLLGVWAAFYLFYFVAVPN